MDLVTWPFPKSFYSEFREAAPGEGSIRSRREVGTVPRAAWKSFCALVSFKLPHLLMKPLRCLRTALRLSCEKWLRRCCVKNVRAKNHLFFSCYGFGIGAVALLHEVFDLRVRSADQAWKPKAKCLAKLTNACNLSPCFLRECWMLIAAVTRTDLVSPRAIGTLFVSDGIDAVEMYPPIYKSKFFVWQTLLSRQAGAPSPTAKLCHGLKAFRKSSSQAEACGSILTVFTALSSDQKLHVSRLASMFPCPKAKTVAAG